MSKKHMNPQSWWFGRLLTWRWFVVFTRLSYAVYLTQFPIFFYNVGQARVAQQYSIFRLLDLPEYIAVLLASAVLTVMFDLPAQNLKKAFLSSSKGARYFVLNICTISRLF
ncbi:hypothetical protein J6590_048710 [Homalodisca vitripennis]|nr:hypothetical protein J6590_048710 [Homalodisca vitripennis]